MPTTSPTPAAPPSYTQKVLIAVGISLAAILLAALIYYTAQLLVLCFAGLLFSVFLSAPADLLAKRTRIHRTYALGIVVASLFLLLTVGGYFLGSRIYKQGVELSRTVPAALAEVERDLYKYLPAEEPTTAPTAPTTSTAPTPLTTTVATTTDESTTLAAPTAPTSAPSAPHASPFATWLADKLIALREAATEIIMSESFVKGAGGLLSSTVGIIGNLIIVFGLGLFFAMSPASYSHGLILLVPPASRTRVSFILHQISAQLQWWFVGQLCSMLTVGLLAFIGLSLLNVPMAFTLAILAGLLNFVPYVGPIAAAIPAVLIAFAPHGDQTSLNPHLAAWTIALYVALQILDGWLFSPYYQKRAVNVPTALIIISQIALSLLLGPLGLILATPLLASILVLLRTLYIEDILGDKPQSPPPLPPPTPQPQPPSST